MSVQPQTDMAPDSHADSAGTIQLIADMTITSSSSSRPAHHHAETGERSFVTTSPLPNGILFKGKKLHKRVSFRDSQLVNIREIPPRSSSADEESEDDDDDDAVSSDSGDEDTDSDSGEEAAAPQQQQQQASVVVNSCEKPVNPAVSRATTTATPSPPVPTLGVRPERAPIPWTPVSSYTGAKGSYNVAVSPASKVVSLVSRITGVSTSATQSHIKQRSAVAASTTSQTSAPARKPPSPVPPKKAPTVMRTEKKVKKITPTLDNVMTSQTVRSVQKHGAVSEALHKGGGSKSGRKKRTPQRRQEGNEKRKSAPSRKTGKDSKVNSTHSKAHDASKQTVSAKRNVSSAGARPRSVTNGFSHVKDSLSLPPLSSDDSVLPNPSKLLQHRPVAKASVYSVDGFIFPGDPTHDLTAGLKTPFASSGAEEVRPKPHCPPATPVVPGYYASRDPIPGQAGRDRVSSAPAGSINRRKRFYAWQMANGNLQNSLHEPPSITPMWENMAPVPVPAPKPAYVADR